MGRYGIFVGVQPVSKRYVGKVLVWQNTAALDILIEKTNTFFYARISRGKLVLSTYIGGKEWIYFYTQSKKIKQLSLNGIAIQVDACIVEGNYLLVEFTDIRQLQEACRKLGINAPPEGASNWQSSVITNATVVAYGG